MAAVLDPLQPLPRLVADRLPTRADVLAHDVEVNGDRWRHALAGPGTRAAGGLLDRPGRFTVARDQVMALGEATITEASATELFYASLAWGLGLKGRNLEARVAAFAADPAAPGHLAQAWSAVRAGQPPGECYEALLSPKGRPRIRFFGAAFATKFLYFAHGATEPTNLILDAVVAGNLRWIGCWTTAPTYGWWSDTYTRYCDLLGAWSRQAEATRHPEGRAPTGAVRSDQVEMALFGLNRR